MPITGRKSAPLQLTTEATLTLITIINQATTIIEASIVTEIIAVEILVTEVAIKDIEVIVEVEVIHNIITAIEATTVIEAI